MELFFLEDFLPFLKVPQIVETELKLTIEDLAAVAEKLAKDVAPTVAALERESRRLRKGLMTVAVGVDRLVVIAEDQKDALAKGLIITTRT